MLGAVLVDVKGFSDRMKRVRIATEARVAGSRTLQSVKVTVCCSLILISTGSRCRG
ncbi:hypothetical protein ACVXG9_22185 [Escherichia coli]